MEIGNSVSENIYYDVDDFMFGVLRPSTIHKMDLLLRICINRFTWTIVDNSTVFNYEIR